MTVYEDISLAVQKGKAEEVERLTAQALENGENAQDILEKGLLTAMSVIGVRFRDNEIYVPEVL
ncbi:MAG: B12-binding domain-containing protein, partial [Eubacteriales bacterium]|nr:B12-binding domain-containing protein [Eubacteriales bacterium]